MSEGTHGLYSCFCGMLGVGSWNRCFASAFVTFTAGAAAADMLRTLVAAASEFRCRSLLAVDVAALLGEMSRDW